jgi:23S rRNA-/tRNA-specific pseudouridylate synthase
MKPSRKTTKPDKRERKPKGRPARDVSTQGPKKALIRSGSDSFHKILSVAGETDYYVVVDKPALLDSQNSRDDRDSVVGWLERRYSFAGLVHRLDFGTSGLLVCAKNATEAKRLTLLLQQGKIERRYLAIAFGKVPDDVGTFCQPLDGQDAKTHYKVLERYANATLLEVKLETGRKHQIRRHFFEAGFPLLGDHLYKKKGSDRLFHRPALHAASLQVESRLYQAAPPEDFAELLTRLRLHRS